MKCPDCASDNIIKNGSIANGKQKYLCKECGRQFVLNPQKQPISNETKELIDRLLLEKLPLAGISRACKVSETWLQNYVNQKYQSVEQEVKVKKKLKAV